MKPNALASTTSISSTPLPRSGTACLATRLRPNLELQQEVLNPDESSHPSNAIFSPVCCRWRFSHDSVPAQPPVSVRALSRSFGSALALDHVDFDVPQGAIYALVGPNGAGKTTLIKLLLNIIRASSGSATVLGKSSTHILGEAFTRIGYVSENQELPDWMTVTQLLSYLRAFYPQWEMTLEEQLVRQLDLPPDRKLKHLSRGQRMKAALLSVLPYRPSLIVPDEPFSGLDPLVRDELIENLLERAAQDSKPPTILISSPDLAEIESLASHIGYLDRGRLLFSEEISSLSSRFREVNRNYRCRHTRVVVWSRISDSLEKATCKVISSDICH